MNLGPMHPFSGADGLATVSVESLGERRQRLAKGGHVNGNRQPENGRQHGRSLPLKITDNDTGQDNHSATIFKPSIDANPSSSRKENSVIYSEWQTWPFQLCPIEI
jgi:hypothetical protein